MIWGKIMGEVRKLKNVRKKPVPKYTTEPLMKAHFQEVINKSVEIIDRQLLKISKCAKGRTYRYTPEQVQTLVAYLTDRITKTQNILTRKVETEKKFEIGG
jgi:hypothetical protein